MNNKKIFWKDWKLDVVRFAIAIVVIMTILFVLFQFVQQLNEKTAIGYFVFLSGTFLLFIIVAISLFDAKINGIVVNEKGIRIAKTGFVGRHKLVEWDAISKIKIFPTEVAHSVKCYDDSGNVYHNVLFDKEAFLEKIRALKKEFLVVEF